MTYQEIILNRPDLKEEMEERAGIIQFDANYTRQEAEDLVAKRMHEKYLIFKQGHLFNGGKY